MALAARGKAMLGSGDVLAGGALYLHCGSRHLRRPPHTAARRRRRGRQAAAQLPNLVKKGSFMLVDEARGAGPWGRGGWDHAHLRGDPGEERDSSAASAATTTRRPKRAAKNQTRTTMATITTWRRLPRVRASPLHPGRGAGRGPGRRRRRAGAACDRVWEDWRQGRCRGARGGAPSPVGALVLIRMFSLDGIDVSGGPGPARSARPMINAMHALLARIDKVGK